MSLKRLLRDFANWTSAHGLPHVGTAQNIGLRLFWSAVFLACFATFIYQIYELIAKYKRYDVTVQTELKFEQRNFPAVTLCNLNPLVYDLDVDDATLQRDKIPQAVVGDVFRGIKQSAVGNTSDAVQQINDLSRAYKIYRRDPDIIPAGQQAHNFDWSSLDSETDTWFSEIPKEERQQATVQNLVKQKLVYLLRKLKETDNGVELDKYTYSIKKSQHSSDVWNWHVLLSGIVLSCSYNVEKCNLVTTDMNDASEPPDFRKRYDSAYGNCITFNHLGNKTSARAGPIYGLRLIAVANQATYLPSTDSVGVRVTIHGFDEEPFPDSFGYNAAAGFTTSFGIKFIKTVRLDYPHGDCVPNVGDDGSGKIETDYYYPGNYTVEGCFRSCYQKMIQQQCDCYNPRFNRPRLYKVRTQAGKVDLEGERISEELEGKEYCELTQSSKRCVDQLSRKNLTDTEQKEKRAKAIKDCKPCQQPCDEASYSVTVSTAMWPSEAYTPEQCKEEKVENKKNCPYYPWTTKLDDDRFECKRMDCIQWFRENTMLIEVYYERMNYQELRQSKAYSLINLISDMGGQLGLWLGVSVITMIEFLSLLYTLVCYCCDQRRRRQKEPYFAGGEPDKQNPFDGAPLMDAD